MKLKIIVILLKYKWQMFVNDYRAAQNSLALERSDTLQLVYWKQWQIWSAEFSYFLTGAEKSQDITFFQAQCRQILSPVSTLLENIPVGENNDSLINCSASEEISQYSHQ